MSEITRIIEAAQKGDPKAAEELLPLVYEELRRLAAAKMASETPGHTLQPTALVHEAWLRLTGDHGAHFNSRGHFFAAAAEAMRRILIEHARRKRAVRHGGNQQRVDVEGIEIALEVKEDELLALNDALDKFALQDKAKAELVKLRYFVGLTLEEAADVRGISLATAKRQWTFARAWLHAEISAAESA